MTEAVALEGAWLAQEREAFHQSQRSRAARHRLVVDAALHGEVELVAFWAGQQAAPRVQVEARDAPGPLLWHPGEAGDSVRRTSAGGSLLPCDGRTDSDKIGERR